MTVLQALNDAQSKLKVAGISSARLDAELLLAQLTSHDRPWILAHGEHQLDQPDQERFFDLVTKRANRIPLVHLTQNREFYGLDLKITPNVLTPRVETEQMVDWAIKYAPKNSKLIDIGTGSGAIAIAIAKHRPDLEVWATEVTPEALQVAETNSSKHKLNINFVQSDLFEAISERFQTVVTNLPYLQNDADLMPEVTHEPAVALFGGDDGLDLYRRFFKQLRSHLEPGGFVFTECDPWQQDNLIAEAAKAKLKPIERGYFITGFKNDGTI